MSRSWQVLSITRYVIRVFQTLRLREPRTLLNVADSFTLASVERRWSCCATEDEGCVAATVICWQSVMRVSQQDIVASPYSVVSRITGLMFHCDLLTSSCHCESVLCKETLVLGCKSGVNLTMFWNCDENVCSAQMIYSSDHHALRCLVYLVRTFAQEHDELWYLQTCCCKEWVNQFWCHFCSHMGSVYSPMLSILLSDYSLPHPNQTLTQRNHTLLHPNTL